jgi:hypothetical protein
MFRKELLLNDDDDEDKTIVVITRKMSNTAKIIFEGLLHVCVVLIGFAF